MSDVEPSLVLRGRCGSASCVVFHQNNSLLLSGHCGASKKEAAGSLVLWELPSGERREQVALDAGVVSVATAGSRLLSQDREGSLRLWDVGGGGFVESERLPTGCNTMCRCAVREQDERLVAVMPQAVDDSTLIIQTSNRRATNAK